MIPCQPSKKLILKNSLSLFSIILPMNKFLTFAVPVTFATILLSTNTFAEEGSLWQKFVDFFTPSESIEGEGPLYDELKELDAKISKTEGKYSRERRPGNKARLKKDLERMRSERSKLIDEIRKNEKQGKISSEVKQSATSSSSAKPISSQATAINKAMSIASQLNDNLIKKLYPLIDVCIYSVEEGYNSASQTAFGIGFYNFEYVLKDPYFIQAIKNTCIIVLITVPVSTGLALLISLKLIVKGCISART